MAEGSPAGQLSFLLEMLRTETNQDKSLGRMHPCLPFSHQGPAGNGTQQMSGSYPLPNDSQLTGLKEQYLFVPLRVAQSRSESWGQPSQIILARNFDEVGMMSSEARWPKNPVPRRGTTAG